MKRRFQGDADKQDQFVYQTNIGNSGIYWAKAMKEGRVVYQAYSFSSAADAIRKCREMAGDLPWSEQGLPQL